jgi:TrmH family RNA methyltransferase
MPVMRGDLKEIIPSLKAKGFKIVGSALRGAKDISEIVPSTQMAFIMGNEGQGMKEETLDLCDEALYIPIGHMESLNVGVAAGIIMYTFRK